MPFYGVLRLFLTTPYPTQILSYYPYNRFPKYITSIFYESQIAAKFRARSHLILWTLPAEVPYPGNQPDFDCKPQIFCAIAKTSKVVPVFVKSWDWTQEHSCFYTVYHDRFKYQFLHVFSSALFLARKK